MSAKVGNIHTLRSLAAQDTGGVRNAGSAGGSAPRSVSGSRLHETTEAYRQNRGTTARTVEDQSLKINKYVNIIVVFLRQAVSPVVLLGESAGARRRLVCSPLHKGAER